jgi:hypothetical protein
MENQTGIDNNRILQILQNRKTKETPKKDTEERRWLHNDNIPMPSRTDKLGRMTSLELTRKISPM